MPRTASTFDLRPEALSFLYKGMIFPVFFFWSERLLVSPMHIYVLVFVRVGHHRTVMIHNLSWSQTHQRFVPISSAPVCIP